MLFQKFAALSGALALAACGEAPYDPRGVDHDETLLSVSATGEAETRPDQARFQAGIESWAPNARAASDASAAKIREIVAALREAGGIAEKDIQTRSMGVQRIEYGPRRGQYQANNIVAVTVRDVDRTGAAVSAVTDAGANIVSGPDLRMSDPEKAATSAYGNAYRAARARAEAYAEAAGMEISRVLSIRDAGGAQGNRYLPGAAPVAPPPPPVNMSRAMAEEAMATSGGGVVMAGQTTSAVSVQVDFALVPK
jgi:uncharacterized protein YggE